jgi:SAM-dependent methyltransferase
MTQPRENTLSHVQAAPVPMATSKAATRLHLGCGLITPEGWINVDGSWNARIAKHRFLRKLLTATSIISKDKTGIPWNPKLVSRDVRKRLPFPDGSLDAVYASHLLEHLYADEARKLLRECFRVLRPGGVLRMVVPDLRAAVMDYLNRTDSYDFQNSAGAATPADFLNSKLLLRSSSSTQGNVFNRIYSQLKDFHSHKYMYDAKSLCAEFSKIGFVDVSEMQLHESRIAGVEEVEDKSRVLNGEGICVEAVKPVPVSP